jgi:hypothetical protein
MPFVAVEVDRRMKLDLRLEGRELHPRATRVDVRFDALVRVEWGAVDGLVLNVSSEGFRLHTAEELEVGTQVSLEVEKLPPVRGEILWVCGYECGGLFTEAVAL